MNTQINQKSEKTRNFNTDQKQTTQLSLTNKKS